MGFDGEFHEVAVTYLREKKKKLSIFINSLNLPKLDALHVIISDAVSMPRTPERQKKENINSA